MPENEATTKQIVGQCVQVEERPGVDWVKFHIDVGSQYPVKLSTKVAAIIEQARGVGSDVATWTFKEMQGNPNPNKPGTFFTNRYLDKVEPGENGSQPENTAGSTAATQQPTQQTPLPTPHHDPIAPADKDRAITRMSCLSSAAQFVRGGTYNSEVERVAAWLSAAAAAERHVYRGIDDAEYVDPDGIPF